MIYGIRSYLATRSKNTPRFFTIRGRTPVEFGCLRNVCTPLNPMFYCLDLDYRRGLFRHDLSNVPSRVFVLFSLWHLSLFLSSTESRSSRMCFKAKDTSARDKTSDENEDLRNQITDVMTQQRIPVVVSLMTFLS